jgi:hypothetical protein
MEEPESTKKCATCDRSLDLGVEVIRTEIGVMGGQGFVPLEDPMIFCSDKCADDYFRLEDSFPPRIP